MASILFIFVISFAIIGGAVWLGNLFFRLDNQKKYIPDTPISSGGKKVKWKSGNPMPWSVTSDGYDVTETLVAHGASEIPEKGRYLYFPLLVLRDGDYESIIVKHKHVLCIEKGGKILTKERVNVSGDPAKELLRAARSGYATFDREWKKVLKQREFEDFVAGRVKKNALPVIGEKSVWVEDN